MQKRITVNISTDGTVAVRVRTTIVFKRAIAVAAMEMVSTHGITLSRNTTATVSGETVTTEVVARAKAVESSQPSCDT